MLRAPASLPNSWHTMSYIASLLRLRVPLPTWVLTKSQHTRDRVFDVPTPAADGTFSADLEVSSNDIPCGAWEYEVILTYRPLDDAHPLSVEY